jgi:hypothetical protein
VLLHSCTNLHGSCCGDLTPLRVGGALLASGDRRAVGEVGEMGGAAAVAGHCSRVPWEERSGVTGWPVSSFYVRAIRNRYLSLIGGTAT